MQPAPGVKVKDPMKTDENGKEDNRKCCCFSWFGRKVKHQDSELKRTDSPRYQITPDRNKNGDL